MNASIDATGCTTYEPPTFKIRLWSHRNSSSGARHAIGVSLIGLIVLINSQFAFRPNLDLEIFRSGLISLLEE